MVILLFHVVYVADGNIFLYAWKATNASVLSWFHMGYGLSRVTTINLNNRVEIFTIPGHMTSNFWNYYDAFIPVDYSF